MMPRLAWVLTLAFSSCPAFGQDNPKVLAAWPAGPMEARIAFDRPLDAGIVSGLVGRRIAFDEGSRPSGQVSGSLNIAGARLVDGGKTLALFTDPHSGDVTYRLRLPKPLDVDVSYTLRGVESTWADPTGKAFGKGWSPLFEIPSEAGSAGQVDASPPPGTFKFRSLAVLPKGKIKLNATASGPFELEAGNDSARGTLASEKAYRASLAYESDGQPFELIVTVKHDGKGPLSYAATFDDGSGPKGLPRSALTLPWAPPRLETPPASPVPNELIAGGDPVRGAAVFKGDQAKCANCHKVRGEGKEVGPDLSDLVKRDRAWVYRNIAEPSATIHPDYVPYTVLTKDGRVLVGIVRAEGADAIRVLDTEAKATTIARADVEELRPSATSIMPVGLIGPIGEAGVRDLVAFLTTPPAETGKP